LQDDHTLTVLETRPLGPQLARPHHHLWLGAGAYDFFLTREIAWAAGQSAELLLMRVRLPYGAVNVG